MPRGIKGSGPNGVKTVQTLTILTESQKTSLLSAAKSITDILGVAPVAQHTAQPVVRRRRRRNTQPEQPQM